MSCELTSKERRRIEISVVQYTEIKKRAENLIAEGADEKLIKKVYACIGIQVDMMELRKKLRAVRNKALRGSRRTEADNIRKAQMARDNQGEPGAAHKEIEV